MHFEVLKSILFIPNLSSNGPPSTGKNKQSNIALCNSIIQQSQQQQQLLREIFKEPPAISYRKGCSLRHIYESKIIKKASKLDIPRSRIKHVNNIENLLEMLRSHLGLSTPIYTGALIKPVSKANKYFLMSLRSGDA